MLFCFRNKNIFAKKKSFYILFLLCRGGVTTACISATWTFMAKFFEIIKNIQTSHLEKWEAKVVYEGQRSNLLTLRTPEACSAERAAVLNSISSKKNEIHVYPTYNVKIIFHNLFQYVKSCLKSAFLHFKQISIAYCSIVHP